MVTKISLRILIIEDHALTAHGMKLHIERTAPGSVCDVFITGHGADVDRLLNLEQYDIYIVDLELKGTSGMEVIGKIRKINPESKILVCTFHEEIWYRKMICDLHVNGLLYKSDCIENIGKAITDIASGKNWFCDKYRNSVNSAATQNYNYLLKESFSKNEMDVLLLIMKGYTNNDIADQKSWSISTVECYRKRLFDKFGASNAPQLIAIAIKEGFIKKEDV